MKTSFLQLLSGEKTRSIVIPRYQRDYAQGGREPSTERVRRDLVRALLDPLRGEKPLVLDFIFGSSDEQGVFAPLDGQQRLTTLFLLHWYVAKRAGASGDATSPLANFGYDTRVSARDFCRALAEGPMPDGEGAVSERVRDQPWFLSSWRHDPTVDGMLTTLDEIEAQFGALPATEAWRRLSDPTEPALSLHHVPIEGMGDAATVYIRMNARGKPLTPFEILKSRLQEALPTRRDEFSVKVDGAWADMLWEHHGGDFLIDDEFMRYLGFLTETLGRGVGRVGAENVEARALEVFGAGALPAVVEGLFHGFDAWCDPASRTVFSDHLSLDQHVPGRVALFSTQPNDGVELFARCCRHYGERFGNAPAFPLQRIALLRAVLVHLQAPSGELARRLRVLRNLTESTDLNDQAFPGMIEQCERFMRTGDLSELRSFHAEQLKEERAKADLLVAHPDLTAALHALEDHPLLRGCLAAFALEADTFAARALAFIELFSDGSWRDALAAALVSCGAYWSFRRPGKPFFGTAHGDGRDNEPWRQVFNVACDRGSMRPALGALLDGVAAASGPMAQRLSIVSSEFLRTTEKTGELDWRYYYVKYAALRRTGEGYYALGDGGWFSVCMLPGRALNGYYRDAYHEGIRAGAGATDDALFSASWFRGEANTERWLTLKSTGTALRWAPEGLRLRAPEAAEARALFEAACRRHGVGDDLLLRTSHDGRVDARDRVEAGAALLRALLDAGL